MTLKVIVDDLSLCLREEIGNTGNSYNVVFDLNKDSDIVRNLVAQGFEYTNEGSLVRRDTDGYIDGIVAIVNTNNNMKFIITVLVIFIFFI